MTTDRSRTLPIEGMSCEHCAERVTNALEGVAQATVDLEAEEATVTSSDHVSRSRLADAVGEAGYEVPAGA